MLRCGDVLCIRLPPVLCLELFVVYLISDERMPNELVDDKIPECKKTAEVSIIIRLPAMLDCEEL